MANGDTTTRSAGAATASGTGVPTLRRPRTWALWTLPRPVVASVLVVDALALLIGVPAALSEPVTGSELPLLGLIVLGAMVHNEVAARVERRAAAVAMPHRVNVRLTAMWPFAAILLLPLALALAVVAVDFAHWGLRSPRRPPPYRCVFAAASVVLGSTAAWAVLRTVPVAELLRGQVGPMALGVVAVAVVLRWAINFALVAGLVSATYPTTTWRSRLVAPGDAFLGLGALGLGVALAAIAATRPWLTLFVVVPLVAMQHGLLLAPLVHAARTDEKTGAADAAHWRLRTADAVRRSVDGVPVSVLMVDLDHFKAVNDTWGHLAGDRALRAVADVLTAGVGPDDVVGRFGGEEFAVLLPRRCDRAATATAERLRRAVRDLVVEAPVTGGPTVRGLSVSIGVATYPTSGGDVDAVMGAADAACYRAKRAGRDRVRVAEPGGARGG